MNTSNIANGANVSNLIASSISKLNLNSVKKPSLNLNKEVETPVKQETKLEKEELQVNIPDEKPKISIDVQEIQKYANMVGENVSIDDINYGIMYGRSVIADYIA